MEIDEFNKLIKKREEKEADNLIIAYSSSKKETKEEKPKRLTNSRHVVYWAEESGMLLGDMKSKAQKFLEMGCILETEDTALFVVNHIEGYNKTNHQVNIKHEKCSCQASRRNNIICSHIQAVKLYIFQRSWNGKDNKSG